VNDALITNTVREPSNANERRDADYLIRGLPKWKGAAEERDTGDRLPRPDESLQAQHVVRRSV
jgi:hypothetical protein